MSCAAVAVQSLSKAYRIGLKEEIPDTMVEAMTGWLKAPLHNFRNLKRLNTFRETTSRERDDTVWALRDVSCDIRQGEVVGIIGRNGAGKSTLLKILSRITEPTAGRAVIQGVFRACWKSEQGFIPR